MVMDDLESGESGRKITDIGKISATGKFEDYHQINISKYDFAPSEKSEPTQNPGPIKQNVREYHQVEPEVLA